MLNDGSTGLLDFYQEQAVQVTEEQAAAGVEVISPSAFMQALN
jgi:hypothetical protein